MRFKPVKNYLTMRIFKNVLTNIFLLGGLTLTTCNKTKAKECHQNPEISSNQFDFSAKLNYTETNLGLEKQSRKNEMRNFKAIALNLAKGSKNHH